MSRLALAEAWRRRAWDLTSAPQAMRSKVLMFLFGWELFLTPIAMVLAFGAALLSSIPSLFRRGEA